MKKNSFLQTPISKGLKKLLLIMKFTTIILLVSTLTISASVFSQRVTLNMQNVSVRDVFDQMEKEVGYKFFYLDEQINDTRKVNVNFNNERIDNVINYLFQNDPIRFKVFEDNLVVISPFVEAQQTREITGKVTDAETGEPLPGVNVVEKGTSNGTITDATGKYSLKLEGEDAVLAFSFIGYASQEIPVGENTVIDVSLSPNVEELDELVVVGYGMIKKRDITGSISSVDGDKISASGFSNLGQALQGSTAGVYSVSNSGKPGEDVSIKIRGVGGINEAEPLYIIDGIQGASLSTININDIESIEILKDASSAAIYGARGAQGVVLISTKKGSSKGLSVQYSGYYGVQNQINVGNLEFLNAKQVAEVFNEAYVNDGYEPPFGGTNTAEWPADIFKDPSQIGEGTNWWDVMTNKNAPIQEHVLSVSGGNKTSKVYSSLSYFDQEGIVINTGFDRYTFRLNSDHKIKDWLTFGNNTSISFSETTGGAEQNKSFTDIFYAFTFSPFIPVYREDGSYAGYPSNKFNPQRNPFALSENTDISEKQLYLLNNVYVDMKILKDFTFHTNFATKFDSRSNYSFYNDIATEDLYIGNQQTYQTFGELNSRSYQWSNTLNYQKTLGRNKISILGGYEIQAFKSNSLTGSGYYEDASIRVLNTNTMDNASGESHPLEGSMISYFGNFTYNFAGKYYLTANIRRDGSSKFGVNNRFGVFPSVSGAWRISEENFMPSFISDLKLRASYGEVGNESIGYFRYIAPMRDVYYPMSNTNGTVSPGLVFGSLANEDLKWETSIQKNVGFDLGLLNNQLYITADYFETTVEDMLLLDKIPATSGINAGEWWYQFNYGTMVSNLGSLKNKGLEFEISYKNKIGDLYYTIGANLTTFNNEVIDIGDNDYLSGVRNVIGGPSPCRTEEGRSLGEFYGYIVEGLFQNQAEVDAANAIDGDPTTPYQFAETAPGDFKYKDINGDGVITSDDRDYMGSPIPDFTYGFNMDLKYKDFSLYALFSGVQGNEIYNAIRATLEGNGDQLTSMSTAVLDAWTGEGTSDIMPRRTSENLNNISDAKSVYVEDGSYFRLRTVQLNYFLPENLAKKMLMQKANVFVAADNILTISGYKGFDPEVNNENNLDAGLDMSFYPNNKTIRFGVNVTF